MNVIIVEDEIAASENLVYLLEQIDPQINVIKTLDAVKASVAYFKEDNSAELIFMDIHLADGISFEIFEQVQIKTPVIFTTAYDQYAIQAFKVNSVDYILKPINKDELSTAINKFKSTQNSSSNSATDINGLLQMIQSKTKSYKSTF